MQFKKFILLIIISSISISIKAQALIQYKDYIYKENIKTVLFNKLNVRFSYPIIDTEKQNMLKLSFDDLNEEETDYSYTIIHCNSDWEPSELNPIEYIEGFEENQIENYENSFNTIFPYNHYEIIFPNENIKPLLSGNYILFVYEDYDRDKIVLSRRFYVVDSKVDIDAEIKRSTVVNSIDDSQEIIFSVIDKSNLIFNPHDNLKITVSQNNIQDILINNIKPDFIKGNLFEFQNPRELRFKGANEFRYFNVKNTKYVNDRIQSISYKEPHYIFNLVTEKCEAFIPYSYAQDINGDFLVTADNVDDVNLESEYVYVDFKLRYDNPTTTGKIYVYGAISDWKVNKENEMQYDYGEKAYKLRMLLKQGFYNYQYVYVDNLKQEIDFSLTEGNHYETENNYVIFVYYRQQGGEYDELIGYKVINSLKKL